MSLVLDHDVPPTSRTTHPARAVLTGALATAAMAVVTASLGGAAALLPFLVGATLLAVVQLAALTLPALFVVQALVGARATPTETTDALASGVEEAGALLLALLPLALLFGTTAPDPFAALGMLFVVVQAGVVAGLVRARRALLEHEPELTLPGRLAVTGWVAAVALVAFPSGIYALRTALRVLA